MFRSKIVVLSILVLTYGFSQANDVSLQKGRVVPRMLNYQGYLTDTLDVPIDDSLDMWFRIFDVASAGTELWSETQTNVPVERGVFSVLLGETNAIPASVFEATNRWLELTIEGTQTLAPRTRITSVGYAYTSTYSDTAEYARNADADNDWSVSGNVLYPTGEYGLSMRSGNIMHGTNDSTHVCFGIACTTGTYGGNSRYCTVGGGLNNTARGDLSTVAGGLQNRTSMFNAAIGGGSHNHADGACSFIGGGDGNQAIGDNSTIGGGASNTASGIGASISGGRDNTSISSYTTVGGGRNNTASGNYTTISGGVTNTVSSQMATVGGGMKNAISGNAGTIAGGYGNSVEGDYSAICGGYADSITATADYSYLFGIGSKLTQDSTFMVDMPYIRFGGETNGYEFPVTDGAADQVLTTDGSGQLSWADQEADTDWVISGSNLYSGVSGNVGIGITNPGYKLDVDGTTRFAVDAYRRAIIDQDGSSLRLYLYDGSSANPKIAFGSGAGTATIETKGNQGLNIDVSGTSPALGYKVRTDNGAGAMFDRIVIPKGAPNVNIAIMNSNVGIGTTSPSAKLEVDGNTYIDGNLGIGTASPSEELEVNGNAHINGNLTWQAETSYVSVSAAAFQSFRHNFSGNPDAYSNSGFSVRGTNNGYAPPDEFVAPIHVPHNATVTKLTFYWCDNSITNDGSLSLCRNTMDDTWPYPIASASTTGSGGNGISSDGTIEYATIDNSQYSYFLRFIIHNDTELILYGAVVEYTITKPY